MMTVTQPRPQVSAQLLSFEGARAARARQAQARRILDALRERVRYRYVQPRVEPEGEGWRVCSPCCSRNVDPAGGEIDIAWLEPDGGGLWRLHARDHVQGRWVMRGGPAELDALLDLVCVDPEREFWP